MAWNVQWRRGLWLPQTGWWLDAQRAMPRAIVSHAHSDHVARHQEVVCTPDTARLLRARIPGRRQEHVLRYGQCEALTPEVTVTLHPAGHILGSSMIELTSGDGTLLYTGDFKLRPGLAAEPCRPPRADVLIMETTFGLPRYVFPPDENVIADLIRFCQETVADGGVPVLFCYSLGKSQEVLRALAPAGLPVMLHEEALRLTRIHAEAGVIFPAHRGFDAREVGGHVVICPPPHQGSGGLVARIPGARTAVLTGWALDAGAIYRYRCDAAFPLSDHAGYPDLLRLVGLVQPRLIYTVHGFADAFARTLRQQGWEAWALGRENQMDLPLAGAGAN